MFLILITFLFISHCVYLYFFQKVIDVLQSHSGSGGFHENTLLVVMGDHGQTLHGDHGGGSAEEVNLKSAIVNYGVCYLIGVWTHYVHINNAGWNINVCHEFSRFTICSSWIRLLNLWTWLGIFFFFLNKLYTFYLRLNEDFFLMYLMWSFLIEQKRNITE